MLEWLKALTAGRDAAPLAGPMQEEGGLGMARSYVALHRYLDARYADVVVLTFHEIEDLLGFTLPVSAKRDARWWANDDLRNASHANAWLLARRSATPNIGAGTVSFERGYRPDAGRP